MNTNYEIAHEELYGVKTVLSGGGHGSSYEIGSKKHIDQIQLYILKIEDTIIMSSDEVSELYNATKEIYDKRVQLVSLLKKQDVNIDEVNELNNLIKRLVESYEKRNNYLPC